MPKQCSGVAQRLVRDRYIDPRSHEAWALDLFLGTVADAQGLSFYSARSLCQRLSLAPLVLRRARQTLSQRGLVAYDHPRYQVFALDEHPLVPRPRPPRMTGTDTPMAIQALFKHIAETLS